MAEVTLTTAAKLIPELWYEAIQGYKERVLRLRPLVMDMTSYIQAQTGGLGSKVNIPLIYEDTAATLTSGNALTHGANTDEEAEMTFAHYYESKRIGDIVKVQAIPSMIDGYSKAMAYALAKAEESVIATAIQGGSTAVELTTGNTLTDAAVLTALVAAIDAGVDPEVDLPGTYMTLSPLAYKSAISLAAFVQHQLTGVVSPAYTGVKGLLYGMRVIPSTDWSDATTVNTVTGSIFTGDSVAFGYQIQPTVEVGRDINYLSDVIAHHAVMGAVALTSTNLTTGFIYNWDNPAP